MTAFGCPVCGAPDGACSDGQPLRFPPIDLEDDMPKGKETQTLRMPKQFVREGRGVPGYLGNVETYDPRGDSEPTKVKRISGEQKQRAPKENK